MKSRRLRTYPALTRLLLGTGLPIAAIFGAAILGSSCSDDGGANGAGSDCTGSYCGVERAEMRLSPESLVFDSVTPGVANPQFITIENVGGTELVVSDIRLVTQSDEFKISGVELPVHLAPGEEQLIKVEYIPDDCLDDQGELIITSNGTDSSEVRVPLHPQPMTGQVSVFPNPIDFGRVPSGECSQIPVSVSNSGSCRLELNDVFITGSDDFELSSDLRLPVVLQPSETNDVSVTYCAGEEGFDEAALLIRSDDAANRTVEIPLVANGDQPCVVVTDEAGIDFGQAFIGESHPRTITVTNCSRLADLEVTTIELEAHSELDGRERFEMSDVPDLAELDPLAPGLSLQFVIAYTPVLYTPDNHSDCSDSEGCPITDGAQLVVRSNDRLKDPLEIDVRGVGSENHCPLAVAQAHVMGSSSPWDVMIDAAPLDTIQFDATGSNDPDGTISIYQWEIIEATGASNSRLDPDANSPLPVFFLDFAGSYRFRLRVFDDEGIESCEPAEILVVATPQTALHVECSWVTPTDNNRNDTGSDMGADVDCHLLHPNGCWDEEPWDIHWRNPSSNWGDVLLTEDDPTLDIDDTDGWGPENISLDQPEGSVGVPFVYEVGVFYFDDNGFGESDVTVNITLDGIPVFSDTMTGLEHREFWNVASIEWPSREVRRAGTVQFGFPSCR